MDFSRVTNPFKENLMLRADCKINPDITDHSSCSYACVMSICGLMKTYWFLECTLNPRVLIMVIVVTKSVCG